mgnify:CR=1 FL=1
MSPVVLTPRLSDGVERVQREPNRGGVVDGQRGEEAQRQHDAHHAHHVAVRVETRLRAAQEALDAAKLTLSETYRVIDLFLGFLEVGFLGFFARNLAQENHKTTSITR